MSTAPRSSSAAAEAGTLVHDALERVVASRNPTEAWTDAVAATADSSGPDAAIPSLSRVRRRYLRVALALIELVERPGVIAHPELEITSADGEVGGTADLILEEANSLTVIDYKSGTVRDGEVTNPHYETQVQIYAALAAERLGKPVMTGLLWSLKQGFVEVDVSASSMEHAMIRARSERAVFNEIAPGRQPAYPSGTQCKWCQHVWQCDEFWAGVQPEWEAELGGHAIEATITGIETSSSGHVAMRVEGTRGTTNSFTAVAGIPSDRSEGLVAGSVVRLAGLYAPKGAEVAVRWGGRGQLGVVS